MKKIIAFLLTLVMLLGMTACGSKTEKDAASADTAASSGTAASSDKPYVAMIALGYSHQFWQAVKQGAEKAADEYGVTITFEGPEQETQVDKQVDMLKTAIQNKPAAICMAAIDVQSVTSILQEQKDAGVPIVGFDAGLGTDLPSVTCSVDNAAAGALAAQHAAEILGDKGKIAILGHTETVQDGVARVQGFVDEITKNHPNIEIVDTQYADGDQLKSAEALKGMLTANPDIQLVYTTNEGACVGAYNGMKELGVVGKVQLIGFDSSAELKAGIKSGDIVGAITQDPITEGYKTVECAAKLIKGEKVDQTFIDTGFYWYNKDNMDDPSIAPCLYD